jgi:hypothetical protein
MNLKVTLLDGTVIYPSYAPEHAEGISAYYNEQQRIGFVKSWRVI